MTTEQTAAAAPAPDLARRARTAPVGSSARLAHLPARRPRSSCSSRCSCRSSSRPSWCARSTSRRGRWRTRCMVNDRILVDEITPRFGGYDRGDIVVFRDPGGWLPPCAPTRRARPLVEARRLGALARRPLRAGQRRPPRQADHRAAGRPRRLLQRDRSDHRQRRADRRDRLPQAPDRRQPGIRRRLRRRRPRGQPVGARRQPLLVEGLALQPGPAGQGVRADRQRRRPRLPHHLAASTASGCWTSTTRCSPAFPSPPTSRETAAK